MKYYPLQRNWRRVKLHLNDPVVADNLVADMHKFYHGTYGKPFTHGMVPHDTESCTWWLEYYDHTHGRMPHYFQYARHAACHWLVNFELELAQLVVPKSAWRIIAKSSNTDAGHSCVWDGGGVIFNFTGMAMDRVNQVMTPDYEPTVTADYCLRAAYKRELKPGLHLKAYYAEHYSVDYPGLKLIA